MRKLILVAAIAFLATSAHAGPSRGLVLAAMESAPAAAPAASSAPATQTAPAQTQAPAKPDKAQAIFEQLVKHGVIKLPNQTPPAAATTPTAPAAATTATTASAPVATPAAPAAVAHPVPAPVAAVPAPVAKVTVEKPATSEPKKVSRAETRIRSELRRHGIY